MRISVKLPDSITSNRISNDALSYWLSFCLFRLGSLVDLMNSAVRGILESMAQCTNSSDIRDNDISFCDEVCDREHQWCSNKSYNQMPVLDESLDNAGNVLQSIALG